MSEAESGDYYAAGYQAFLSEAETRDYGTSEDDTRAYASAAAGAASAAACTAMGLPVAAPACAAIGAKVADWIYTKLAPEAKRMAQELFQPGIGADTMIVKLETEFAALASLTGSRDKAEAVAREFYPGWMPHRSWQGYFFPNYRVWWSTYDAVTGKRMDCESMYDYVRQTFRRGARGPCTAARNMLPMITAAMAARLAWPDYSDDKRKNIGKKAKNSNGVVVVAVAGLGALGIALAGKRWIR